MNWGVPELYLTEGVYLAYKDAHKYTCSEGTEYWKKALDDYYARTGSYAETPELKGLGHIFNSCNYMSDDVLKTATENLRKAGGLPL